LPALEVVHFLFDRPDAPPDRPEIEHHQHKEERVRADEQRRGRKLLSRGQRLRRNEPVLRRVWRLLGERWAGNEHQPDDCDGETSKHD